MADSNFLMETRLKDLDPVLHRKYRDCVVVMSVALERYHSNFPTFTDHSMRHSLDVIEFCNQIIGERNIGLMNAEEIFILLMSIYMHDFGMGIAEKDFLEFIPQLTDGNADVKYSKFAMRETIRKYHHELSAKLIEKYAPLFDVGDESYVHAISQVAKGHRVTDLLNENDYPVAYRLSDGGEVCLPYLAALIRLADEVDIGRDRNSEFSYEYRDAYSVMDIREYSKAEAVKCVDVEDDAFVVTIDRADDDLYNVLMKESIKINKTLNDCINAVNGRTKFTIYQNKVTYIREEQ